MQDMERLLCSGRPYSDLLSFNPPFSLILLNLEGNRCWTRINSAEGLNVRGTHFQAQAGFSHGKADFLDMESLVSKDVISPRGDLILDLLLSELILIYLPNYPQSNTFPW